ncbi:aspartate kinase [Lactobacillus sp. S2-2]|uniref:aspartate kinase n=1 Tax=Lactobacillus sp. S2-2 TaxID=2692917 RepID=UPI001F02273A|nr:aspartate kinase [Lactobacillus sp. S2-2]MCF6515360.1 aspartate kinase [Lactobacillus sp. S2-2]
MIVAKFGGSSLANAEQFKKVKQIISNNKDRNLIVVSALGKADDQPMKLTDQLIKLSEANSLADKRIVFQQIKNRFNELMSQLEINLDLDNEFNDLMNNLSYDELVSRGEYLTALVLARFLDVEMIDAKDFLMINQGIVDYHLSQNKLQQLIKKNQRYIIPGFYGINLNDQIELLPRGGGDTTGSIVANLVDANKYENWTDTNGLLMADPNLIKNPVSISNLSYQELQELSYLGTKVFNDEAIEPVKQKNIPLVILNTNHPEHLGTTISNQTKANLNNLRIKGMTCNQHQVVFRIYHYQLSKRYDLVIKMLSYLKNLNLDYTFEPASFDSINVYIKKTSNSIKIKNDLRQVIGFEKVEMEQNVSIVTVVSEQFKQQPTLVGSLIEALNDSDIKVKGLRQFSDDLKFSFEVEDKDYHLVFEKLYNNINKKVV